MVPESKSELEKRLEGMTPSEQLELVFKMLRENTKLIRENAKALEELRKKL